MVAFIPLLVAAAVSSHNPPRPSVRAKGDLVGLFSDDDYPAEALAKSEEGAVSVRLSVSAEGRVSACQIRMSSTSPSLDEATCRILKERASFIPAHDRRGRPVADTYTQRVTWRIPNEGPLPFIDTRSEMTIALPVSGSPSCTVTGAIKPLPDTMCSQLVEHTLADLQEVQVAQARPVTIVVSNEMLVGEGVPPVPPAAFVRRRIARITIDSQGAVTGCKPMTEAALGGGESGTLCEHADELTFAPLPSADVNHTERQALLLGTTRILKK